MGLLSAGIIGVTDSPRRALDTLEEVVRAKLGVSHPAVELLSLSRRRLAELSRQELLQDADQPLPARVVAAVEALSDDLSPAEATGIQTFLLRAATADARSGYIDLFGSSVFARFRDSLHRMCRTPALLISPRFTVPAIRESIEQFENGSVGLLEVMTRSAEATGGNIESLKGVLW